MANICTFVCRLDLPTNEDYDACKAWLDSQDDHVGSYVHFTGTDFTALDLSFYFGKELKVIRIEGDVKWYIDFNDFRSFTEKLRKDFHVDTLRCTYSEPGCELFGYWEYVSDTGLLVDHRVSDAFIKKAYKEYDIENDDDALDKFLALMWDAPEDAYYEIAAAQL